MGEWANLLIIRFESFYRRYGTAEWPMNDWNVQSMVINYYSCVLYTVYWILYTQLYMMDIHLNMYNVYNMRMAITETKCLGFWKTSIHGHQSIKLNDFSITNLLKFATNGLNDKCFVCTIIIIEFPSLNFPINIQQINKWLFPYLIYATYY